ncbi:hypothetical protein GLW08_10015 [Pontibacillus yanchengensis]|uniref:Uncharacterized protein n=2 Tax=Pontibacillus yanchengensis TaxID=462910 RepID=A0ACC7VHM0_9BACI|nr:hypothetical protein [Pontibacillus yanchengensis]MYL35611.1 hypothetical protein [Pontibacillus yanchengensis]MYL53671.1 hypothetical protein [Pontibacillus yanchengensis]
MKRYLLLFTIVLIGLLSGCGKQSNSYTLQELEKDYPSLEKQLSSLTEEERKRVKIPDYIPFHVTNVEAVVSPNEDQSIVELVFSNGTLNLHVMTMKGNSDVYQNQNQTVELANGGQANYSINEFGKKLFWSDKQSNETYIIKLMSFTPGDKLNYTKKDVVQIANSMYSST